MIRRLHGMFQKLETIAVSGTANGASGAFRRLPRPLAAVGIDSGLRLSLAALLASPILVVAASVFVPGNGGTWEHLRATVLGEYTVNSLWLMLGVACGTSLLGVLPAWLVTMYRFPASRLWAALLFFPLAIPAYVAAYVYGGLLDVAGPVQEFLRTAIAPEARLPPVRSLGGAIVLHSLVLYPYVYLLCRTAFVQQSFCALEVANTLGCSRARTFWRVGLPLARPALAAGLALALMETLADYGAVQYLGVPVFTTGIFRTWYGLGDAHAAAQLAAVLLVFVTVLLALERYSRRRARYYHTSSRYRPLSVPRLRGWPGIAAAAFCLTPPLFGFALPCLILAWRATATLGERMPPGFIDALLNSLGLAAATALLALALALALRSGQRRDPWLHLAANAAGLGYAVPGAVIAVGVLISALWLERRLGALWPEALLPGGLALLIFAYLVRFLALSLNAVEAGLAKIRPSLEEVGRSLRVTPLQVVCRVHLPIMRGSLLTALALVFVDVLKELPATLLLRPFDLSTLAVRAYELAGEERLAESAWPALSIVLISAPPIFLMSRLIAHARPGDDVPAT